jgi:hypothetical protein
MLLLQRELADDRAPPSTASFRSADSPLSGMQLIALGMRVGSSNGRVNTKYKIREVQMTTVG